jgi:hypothetical protein
MGGFFLLHTAPGEDRSPAQIPALAAFARMGMPAPRLVRVADFLLAVYPERQASEPAFEQFSNSDLVCACGTLICEAELIRRADARLATCPSGYGHHFSGPPPLVRRLTGYATYLRPPWLRRFATASRTGCGVPRNGLTICSRSTAAPHCPAASR